MMSDCGLSYHASLTLRPNNMIEFKILKYKSAFDTKMRSKLFTGKEPLFSNELEEQFEIARLEQLSGN